MHAWGLALAASMTLVVASCTGATEPATPTAPSTATATDVPSIEPPPDGPLVLGAPLPDGCEPGTTGAGQTLAFVAGGRAWALAPRSGRLTCLFEVARTGPFAWGPQGDRVLIGGGDVRFLAGGDDVHVDRLGTTPFGWGRPIGKAIVYAEVRASPGKVSMDDGSVISLRDLPRGSYEAIAYHPSGLALAVSVADDGGTPQIFLSTNEGLRPKRIVVGVSATHFPSLGFTDGGRRLIYLADHLGGFAQVHMIDLTRPDELVGGWKSQPGVSASGLVFTPDGGGPIAFTVGTICDDSVAMTGSVFAAEPAMPDEGRPTRAVGFLDRRHLLVAVGGCDGSAELWVAGTNGSELVVTDAIVGASRADGPEEAAPPPKDLIGEIQEFG